MFSTVAVAKRILHSAREQGLTLTPLQLMKLVYIAHGWWLAQTGSSLIDDEVQAWKFGPVIPALYHRVKKWGRNPIDGEITSGPFQSAPPPLPANARDFLASVVGGYGHFSGIALSNLTHRPGTPWAQMYREGELNRPIPDEVIRRHYEQLLRERTG